MSAEDAATPVTGLTVACAQLPVWDDVDRNLPVVLSAVERAAEAGADILLTPEGSVSGYHARFDAAEVRRAVDTVVQAAVRAGVGLALGTCHGADDGRLYDELRFYDKDGTLLGSHAKILLCTDVRNPDVPAEIDRFATRPLGVVALDGITAGGLVCNDLWANPAATAVDDPHLTQRLAALGAGVVFHTANTGLARGDDLRMHRAFHESNLRLRAMAAGVWIATADVADPTGRLASRSGTGVLDPLGRWVAKAPDRGEALVTARIELRAPSSSLQPARR